MHIINGQPCRYRSGWGYTFVCCDCGLVHRYDFAIRKGGKIELVPWRDDWETKKKRKTFSTKDVKWLTKQFKRKKNEQNYPK